MESGSLSISRLLAAAAGTAGAKPAILAPGREPLSYQQLTNLVADTIGTLHRLGIGRGDRVAMILPNGAEMATAFLAVAATATAAPLNPAYQVAEFDFYLTDLNPRALIIEAASDSPAREVARARGIPLISLTPLRDAQAGQFALTGETSASTSSRRPELGGADDIGLVLHTSGTTSRPKIVPLTHTNLCASAAHIAATLRLSMQDRGLNVMPLFHIHGLVAAMLAPLSVGGSIVCSSGFSAPQFSAWLDEFQPTWYTAVPTMHQAILARYAAEAKTSKRTSLRFIRSSSAALPPPVMFELERVFGVPVIEAYGMTEAAHQMASNPLPPQTRKPGSVGIAAGPEIAIMDESGGLLAVGETGEIVIRGANVMPGYENNPQANQTAFTDGWFRTGDQGRMDDDGYLFITGRLKEIINRGGEKISPREIDEALMEHAAVAQVVAFAAPHPTLGEDLVAAVVLRGGTTATENELRRFAFERLVPFKVPSRIVFVESIPKGATGKLQRIGLHEKLSAVLQRAFVAPRTEIEEILARLWSEVLTADPIGVHDNFFALGGDSLAAGRVAARINSRFELDLAAMIVFQVPSIADQALFIESVLLDQIERERLP